MRNLMLDLGVAAHHVAEVFGSTWLSSQLAFICFSRSSSHFGQSGTPLTISMVCSPQIEQGFTDLPDSIEEAAEAVGSRNVPFRLPFVRFREYHLEGPSRAGLFQEKTSVWNVVLKV